MDYVRLTDEQLSLHSIFPYADSLNAFSVDVACIAVLQPSVPFSSVAATVWPAELAVTLPDVIDEFADEVLAMQPCVYSFTVHSVHFPVALVFLAIRPLEKAFAIDIVHVDLTNVG